MAREDLGFSGHGVHVEEVCGSRVWDGVVTWRAPCPFLGRLQGAWRSREMFELRRNTPNLCLQACTSDIRIWPNGMGRHWGKGMFRRLLELCGEETIFWQWWREISKSNVASQEEPAVLQRLDWNRCGKGKKNKVERIWIIEKLPEAEIFVWKNVVGV